MAKKVKCIECECSMDWAIPKAEELKDNDFTIGTITKTIVCGETMKTKPKDHCQYCKRYIDGGEWRKKIRERYESELQEALKEVEKLREAESKQEPTWKDAVMRTFLGTE